MHASHPVPTRLHEVACSRTVVPFRWLVGVLVTLGSLGAVAPAIAPAAELVVVDQVGCVYCARFEAEIAEAWPNTEQGRRAPLRRVDLHADWPRDLVDVEKPDVTPTFVLLDDAGREVDRLTGYPGDEHFWFLADDMLAKLAPDGDTD